MEKQALIDKMERLENFKKRHGDKTGKDFFTPDIMEDFSDTFYSVFLQFGGDTDFEGCMVWCGSTDQQFDEALGDPIYHAGIAPHDTIIIQIEDDMSISDLINTMQENLKNLFESVVEIDEYAVYLQEMEDEYDEEQRANGMIWDEEDECWRKPVPDYDDDDYDDDDEIDEYIVSLGDKVKRKGI
jgi:hypothetical protein